MARHVAPSFPESSRPNAETTFWFHSDASFATTTQGMTTGPAGSGHEKPRLGHGPETGHVQRTRRSAVAVQRSAKDVTQRGTRIRAAILVNGFFFLGNLACLDRQTQTAG